MTTKRFTYKHFDWLQWHIYKDGEFFIEVTHCEEDAKKLCELLNKLHEENKTLHSIIIEDEKMIQSIYEELTKLRLIKKNLRNIKTQWNWIMESVDYE